VTENESTSGWIVFDAVEIDTAGRRLFVDGNAVALEPKAFAVLHLLASNPGHAFARDDILDAVWGHRHVTPGVLNRVITLLRHALGESADEHRYLHTLHGVGYRFDASVRRLNTRSDAGIQIVAAPTLMAETPTARDLDRHDNSPLATTPATSASQAPSSRIAAENTRTALPTAARAYGRWIFVVALILAAAAFAWHQYGQEAVVPVAQTGTAPALVVLPFRSVGNDIGESALAEGLSEELTTRLARVEGLQLISNPSARLAQQQQLDPEQLAQRLHVTHALEGSLRQAGEQLRIDLRLIETQSGRTIWAQNYDRTLADVFAMQREIAQAVAGALTLRLGLHAAKDGNVEPQVLRDYLQIRGALRAERLGVCRKDQTDAFRSISARAPDFAPAHASLGLILVSNLCPPAVTAQNIADGSREATRALELDPDNAEAYAALALVACQSADWETCMNEFRHALSIDASNSHVRALYAYWLVGLGYREDALAEAETGWALNPLHFQSAFVRGRILDTLGRHDEAKTYLDALPNLNSTVSATFAYSRWYNAIWRHDLTAASEFVKQMPEQESFRDAYNAGTQALADPARWPQAEAVIAESEAKTGKYNFLRLQMPQVDIPTAIVRIEQMLRRGFPSYYMLFWQPEYAFLRRDPAFQDFLKHARIIDYWRSHGWPPQCKPEGDGARCE
jgi:TolB-like protein/DNA-binding winged helix-turn-helix (wHTH) protein